MMNLAIIATFLLLSSVISSVLGVAGGSLSLIILSTAYGIKTAIPLHGLLQAFSNLSRIIIFFRHIDFYLLGYFSILILPGSALGAYFFQAVAGDYLEFAIGISILINLYAPWGRLISFKNRYLFIPLGFIAGFLNMIIGITGPFLAPFFYKAGYTKHRFIATKGACQFLSQLAKINSFLFLIEFDFIKYNNDIAVFIPAVLGGTILGKYILNYIDNNRFLYISKILLTIIAIKFLISPLDLLPNLMPHLVGTDM